MIVCLPICSKDIAAMKDLLAWCQKLGGCKGHSALVVADKAAPFDLVVEILQEAKGVFSSAELITNQEAVSGWPDGPNSMFLAAARHCVEPFLWLESDCVPLRPGWLDAIAAAWDADESTLFMGCVYSCTQPFLPSRVMSGVAVYTPAGIGHMPFLPNSPRAWDVDGAEAMVSKGVHTPLIRHFFGEMDLPPTFVARKDAHSPRNALTLENIPPEAVLFHRCKDGTLQRLLERKLFPGEVREKITVCFPVYQGDIGLGILHAKWMQRMGRKHAHKAVICHDPSCPVVLLNTFEQLLRVLFAEVESFVYPRPPIPTYPAAANWAWQSTALHMAKQKSPWFWFEADGVALKPDWIEQLQAEYDACGRSWMGPVVAHMGHCQGTSIYPCDAALRMPGAMGCGAGNAFDMQTKEIIHDCHDASHLMFHLWTLLGRMAHPVGGGEIPANITAAEVSQWLPKSAVFCHRIKDSSLVNLLLRGEFQP